MNALFHKMCAMVKACECSKITNSTSGLIIITMAIMLGSELFALFLFAIVFEISDFATGNVETLLVVRGMDADASQLFALFATIMPVIGILIACKYKFHRSKRSLGLKSKHLIKEYTIGLGIGFLMMSMAVVLAYFSGSLKFEGIQNFSITMIVLYFVAFMVQGFSEELLMRGFFMNACAARKTICYAIFVNSIVFALLHLGNDGLNLLGFLNLILAGIAFSLMAIYFDNIVVCSAAHTMWNFAQGNFFGILVSGIYFPSTIMEFVPSGSAMINGGSFGLEGGLVVSIVEAVTIVALCYLYKRKCNHQIV